MGLLTTLITLPLAPVKGVMWVGEIIEEQVEQQLHDPANVRRELEEIENAAAAGDISPEEKDDAQQAVLNRMISPGGPGADRMKR
ncbi:gas vesicle protein GvpG [Rhodococcus sp. (in: high G+C Gram-positive bacteria)]|uniref:gas vesicle protein GvpG n=1 Tax=unclassified Rhodococcus (in: high G+C Gram-positive bacteria) TaxID=192944 RepID=UPI001A02DCE5|nr:gas vesicle protein GvpG [Rhodococcus sp. (in: high G+C Gram-positive bacteria)]MBF0660849.1 gas vesicle protein GvpG [Rhodococcus sp. (in: high G+C Gram-positive bacteria)]